ncbi:hypothetical protein ARMGADRAFT_1091544 [Armillaria gallica]|uniref:Uncharacterized protein n=1 Tax=Armillaria gallica TaxID=47427 RepID=A0A2H3CDJ0_ARMGA|nr:hypothetical protein ARMGADRAFT_1091544 [Armillaria gallica]
MRGKMGWITKRVRSGCRRIKVVSVKSANSECTEPGGSSVEPTDPAELAKVQAQDVYNVAAAVIDNLLDDFPNPTWDPSRMDTWLIDVVSHWTICEDNWSLAEVGHKDWYKLEYSLLIWVPNLPMDLVTFARTEFNDLVERATTSSQPLQDAAAPGSRMTTPAPLPSSVKPTTPIPLSTKTWAIEPSTAKRAFLSQNVGSSVPRLNLLAASPKAPVSSTSNSQTSKKQITQPPADKATGAQQHTTQRKVKPTPLTAGSGSVVFPPDPASPLHQRPGKAVNVGPPVHAARLESSAPSSLSKLLIVDAATCSSVIPGPSPAHKGSVDLLLGIHEPLFFPGTDEEEEQVREDLVEDERKEEIAGTDGEDGDMPGQHDDDNQSSNEATSPPPTKLARRLQKPRTEFVFDDLTGDFDPYPTIFLPRRSVAQDPNLRQSAHPHGSPVNPSAAYLKATQGSKADAPKKKRKDVKRKDKAPEVAVSHKCAQDNDDGAPTVEKPATKRLKLKDTDDKVVHAMPAVCKCGPGLTRPPAVTLGVGGGGFGEKVPSTAKAIKDGLKSIGVLEVEEDFWCICKEALNAFEGALDTLAQHADSIEDIVVNYMAGINTLTQLNGLQVQAGRLRECADFDDNAEDGGEGDEDEVPDDVAEGVSGPSKKKKGKSG